MALYSGSTLYAVFAITQLLKNWTAADECDDDDEQTAAAARRRDDE